MKIAVRYYLIKDLSGFGTMGVVHLERDGLKDPLDIFTEYAHGRGYLTQKDLEPKADVIEIDAASHGGVEDMRRLIDSLSYAPPAPPTLDALLAAGKEFFIMDGWVELKEEAVS